MPYTNMKSAQIRRYGGSEVFEINQSTPKPSDPSASKVLVRVKAAGVNPADWKIREGYMREMMPLQFPSILGMISQLSSNELEKPSLILRRVTRYMDRLQR
jgi:D-arabinose 1-dehydrogenase-like Zn-dependent alcohol dehydrogenase